MEDHPGVNREESRSKSSSDKHENGPFLHTVEKEDRKK